MKVIGLAALLLSSMALASQQATPGLDAKHVQTTLPTGEPIEFSALNIDRYPDTSEIHLKGKAQVTIRETVRAGNRYLVIHADEITYHPKTGEVVPTGNVRITQQQLR